MVRTVLATVSIVVMATSLQAQPAETLTAKDIADAIQLGTYGEPAPYPVHYLQREPDVVNDVVVAVLYTPFVRVALAAKVATAKGIAFEPSDVTAAMIEPVYYVAFRWYCCDGVHGEMGNWYPGPFDYKIAAPGHWLLAWPGSFVTERPLWVTRELTRLNGLGVLPYEDLVLVAGYPMSAIRTHRGYVIYEDLPAASHPHPRDPATGVHAIVGRVTSADLARWR
jgi:hypothetical protein